jgi:ABC-type transport system involved in cytochrome bd biosynthesis fused ATPase/permease subunit
MNLACRAALAAAAAAIILTTPAVSLGQQQVQQREQVQARKQERAGKREIIPGSELMTAQEREAYRQRYAAAGSEAEKEKVRADHVKAMEERAKLRGLQLAPVAPRGETK